jgi:hypothetical protein
MNSQTWSGWREGVPPLACPHTTQSEGECWRIYGDPDHQQRSLIRACQAVWRTLHPGSRRRYVRTYCPCSVPGPRRCLMHACQAGSRILGPGSPPRCVHTYLPCWRICDDPDHHHRCYLHAYQAGWRRCCVRTNSPCRCKVLSVSNRVR